MNQDNLRELLADNYKKRDVISKEIDRMAEDPNERKSKRYTRLIYSQDLLTKRIIDIEERLGDDNEDSDVQKIKSLFALIEYAHTYTEKMNVDTDIVPEKEQLTTFKNAVASDKTTVIFSKTRLAPSLFFLKDAEKELERLLESKRRELLSGRPKKRKNLPE